MEKRAWRYMKRYNGYGNKQVSPFYRFGLFFRSKRFWGKPHLALGVIVLKSLEYIASGIGYIVGKVKE